MSDSTTSAENRMPFYNETSDTSSEREIDERYYDREHADKKDR